MRKLLSTILLLIMLAVPGTMNAGNRYLIVKAGDAESLIDAINLDSQMDCSGDDEQFPVGKGLVDHRTDGVGDEPFHVVAWHDDRDERLVLCHDLILVLRSSF